MEATAIAAICDQTMAVVKGIAALWRVPPKMMDVVNRRNEEYWDAIPRFLAVHYKFNTLIDSPFWRAVWNDIDLYGAEDLVEYYHQCGPDQTYAQALLNVHDQFGLGSYIVMFLGQKVPYANRHQPTAAELNVLARWRDSRRQTAAAGYTPEQALALIRSPGWQWTPGFYT